MDYGAKQLIAVDAGALDALLAEVRALRQEIQAVRIQPQPQWLPVKEYAAHVGRSVSTINRWIAQGRLEVKSVGNIRMVRLS